jgi:TATA-box binding protein (TBP) (component of TFIID and TFIIIB)
MRLTNVVVQADLGCSLDLRVLTYRLTNARYDTKVFSVVVLATSKLLADLQRKNQL